MLKYMHKMSIFAENTVQEMWPANGNYRVSDL